MKLDLEVVKKTRRQFTTTSLELPSVEEALKILAGASQKGRWELLLVKNVGRKQQQLCLNRLGLKVVRKRGKPRTATSRLVSKDILTHEKIC